MHERNFSGCTGTWNLSVSSRPRRVLSIEIYTIVTTKLTNLSFDASLQLNPRVSHLYFYYSIGSL